MSAATDKKSAALEAAEIRKAEAEAEQAIAEAELARAKARAATAEADGADLANEANLIALRDLKRAEERYAASNDQNHVYWFSTAVNQGSVEKCISKLTEWSRLDPTCKIEIVFNSPGGSVIDGFALYDVIKKLQADGHHFTTTVRGMAASMAGILLQAGDTRIVGSESVILVHEISFGAGGKIGEVEDEVAFAKMLTQRVVKIFAARTKLTAKQIDTRWKRKDWWMDSDEALRLGFCDEIR